MIIIKINKKVLVIASLVFVSLSVVGISHAAFTDKGAVSGSSFSVGSSDLKLLESLSLGIVAANLKDEIAGPSFTGIHPNWSSNYGIKLYNNGSQNIQLGSNANYETINDPDDLRSVTFVEPFNWNDTNQDGSIDTGETGISFGRKTIVKWKTEGFDFGTVAPGEIKSIILKFSTDSLSDTKQGKSGIFDFEFDSIGI